MPPRKKPPVFPEDCCGACKFCVPMDDQMVKDEVGVCYSMPPFPCFDGEDITPARPVVMFGETACLCFRPREHA